jgi:rRNA maturation RNase YbeY
MAKGFQGARRRHQQSAAAPSRSGSATAKRSLRSSESASNSAVRPLGTAAFRHASRNPRRSPIPGDELTPGRQRTLPLNPGAPESSRRYPISPSEAEGAGVRGSTPASGAPSASRCRGLLSLRNRQPVRLVDLRLLRRIVQALLRQTWPFLGHKGSTDVITFDYSENVAPGARLPPSAVRQAPREANRDAHLAALHGEIFACLDEAVSQARLFRTTWQSELVRYVVHGVLHLLGYDDLHRDARRRMKAAEDALVEQLTRQFDFRRLSSGS